MDLQIAHEAKDVSNILKQLGLLMVEYAVHWFADHAVSRKGCYGQRDTGGPGILSYILDLVTVKGPSLLYSRGAL